MSEFSENEKEVSTEKPQDETSSPAMQESYHDEYDSFETIFGDPAAHTDKAPKSNGKKRIVSVIAAFLAVAVLVGGTIAVVKLIPVKEDETDDSAFKNISVISCESDKISSVTVTNKNGTFKLMATKNKKDSSDNDESSETVWSVEGIDSSKTSSSSISSVANSAASVSALYEITEKSASDCGFDSPSCTVAVAGEDIEDYTLLVGGASLDGTGVYVKLANQDKIYLAEESAVSGFDFDVLDFADTTSIPAATFKTDVSSYSDDNGTLTSFDTLTVSGKNFPKEVVVVPNDDEALSSFVAYKLSSPSARFADKIDVILNPFTNGISVTGAYSYDVSAKSLAEVGLDNPDVVLTLSIKGEKKVIRISKVDDSNCAVITQDSTMIRKVALSEISFIDYNAENFYSTWVVMQSINDISNFTLAVGDEEYSFDIVYDDSDDAEETYTITTNGKKITASYFQNFYQGFVGLNCVDYTVEKLNTPPSATVKLKQAKDGSVRTVTFTKASETKYQYSIDGIDMGRITSSAYNKIIRNIKTVSENKDVKTN